MNQAEIISTLLIVVAALAILAKKVALPYPVLLVIGGLALGFVPGLPAVQLEPDTVFLFLLPPLLYPAALFTSWRDFRANLNAISLLAIWLVLFTTAVVAVVAHALSGLPWAAAFALGAIVSPTDAIAATAIANRLGVPRRIVTILEGESLINDATALVAYRFAIAALSGGRFSLFEASGRFVLVALGGAAIGLAIGWLASQVQRRLDDPPVQITISLLTPFAAYIPAERLHVSGVLAVVVAGLFLGWRAPQILTSRTRLNAFVFWEIMVFLLNGLVFVLIGLQLPRIPHESGQSLIRLISHGALISAAAIAVRIVWVFAATNTMRLASFTLRKPDPYPSWQNAAVIAWTGMRGVVSLAAALALPLTLPDGSPFPGRNYILCITFCVIFATLVLQGLSLPALIRRLGVVDDGAANLEERTARLKANEAALAYLTEVDGKFPPDLLERLRVEYNDRIRQLEVCAATHGDDNSDRLDTPSYERLQREALAVERRTIIQLRDEYIINDEVLRRIQSDLDHAEARLGV
jgi:CPA1 family monovalent cation:H+ antiporter